MGKLETRLYKIGKYKFDFSIYPHWILGYEQSICFGLGFRREIEDGETVLWIDLGLIDLILHIWKK